MTENPSFKIFLAALIAAASLVVVARFGDLSPWKSENAAAVFGVDTVKTQGLKEKYAAATSSSTTTPESKIRIFIMPGHEPDFGGAEYGQLKERDMNLVLASYLRSFLEEDPRFEVVLGRGEMGWNPSLQKYFKEHAADIQKWRSEQANMTKKLAEEGDSDVLKAGSKTYHQTVAPDVALRLYGINKWLGENKFDFAIHVHMNDYGSRRSDRPGEYSGYAIYVPARQYSNSSASRYVARALKDRFSELMSVSDMPREKQGVVEDSELVAVGRFNTAEVPSLLIEYGYIYEPQFQDGKVRDAILREYAYQTYLGIRDFFALGSEDNPTRELATIPHEWRDDLAASRKYSIDILALQIALKWNGEYPPKGKTLKECPISGLFGACTREAVREFQNKYSITAEDGYVGEKTRAILNALFSK